MDHNTAAAGDLHTGIGHGVISGLQIIEDYGSGNRVRDLDAEAISLAAARQTTITGANRVSSLKSGDIPHRDASGMVFYEALTCGFRR